MAEALPRLEQFLREIEDAVVVADAAGNILHLNPAAERLTGWAGERAVGQHVGAVLTVELPPTQIPWASALRAALDSGIAHEYADILLHAGAGARQINQTLYPIPDGKGAILGAAIISRDISHLAPLREERRIAAMAFETTGPLLVASAADLRVVQANPACLQLSQYDEHELVGESLEYLYRDLDKQELLTFFRDPGPPDHMTARTERRNRSGQLLQLLETAAKVRDGDNRVTHFVIGLHDLTETLAATAALRETQLNYQQLVESMHEGVAIIRKGRFLECNAQFARMLGRPREDLVGRTATDVSGKLQPEGISTEEMIGKVNAEVASSGHAWVTWQVSKPGDDSAHFEANISLSTAAGQRILVITARDVTERLRAEQERQRLVEELAARENLIRLSNRAYGIASWEYDPATRIMRWSDDAEDILGLAPGALADGIPALAGVIHPDDMPLVDDVLAQAQRGKGFELDVRIQDRLGNLRWTHTQAECEHDALGNLVVVRGAVADITERKSTQQTIERLAFFDPLTGLANRRLLFDRVKQAVAAARRRGGSGAVLFIDLDHFKRINDSLGHSAGDRVLIEVANRLRALTRTEDTVARLGGDEFVVLLDDVPAAGGNFALQLQEIADRLLARLSGAYRIGTHDYHLSASIGITLFPDDGEDTLELLHRADAAMYQAKAEGRSTISFYQPELQHAADTRLAIERELRIALADQQLELFYQPKVLDGDLLIGAEALLRWRHPQRGLLPPAEFICVAEGTGLIVDVGAWVIDAACRQLAAWKPHGAASPWLGLSVNVSPIQFRHRDLVATVRRALELHGVEPGQLTLEITEGVLIDRVDDVIDKLNQLKALGVQLSIDDFGTGYSSLAYLRHLPLDELKIDRSFVSNLAEDPNNAAIIEGMVAIAKAFGLRVIAEGVETEAEARLLRRLGCRYHQGYLYARPLPADEFDRGWAKPASGATHPLRRAGQGRPANP
jgi:diguanylate cyclase (GGDEF)-like protein/PAS domain S-box-containing protein